MNRTITHSKPLLTEVDYQAVHEVLHSGMIAQGELVTRLEESVAERLSLLGAKATSSGTSALFLGLKALRIGAGDEVILPTYVCRAVRDAVMAAGATPVLCDIADGWCLNRDTVKARITPRTKAVIVVHLFGVSADVPSLLTLGVPVIEDCCQAFGATRDHRLVGTFGEFSFLSFHGTKLLTTGVGGMIVSDRKRFLAELEDITQSGLGLGPGLCDYAMSDMQAALGLSQLQQYDDFLLRRRHIAQKYFEALGSLPIRLPLDVTDTSLFFRYPVRQTTDFEDVQRRFEQLHIHVRRGVDQLLHRDSKEKGTAYPNAERAFLETVSIPIYPALSGTEIERIIEACITVWGDE